MNTLTASLKDKHACLALITGLVPSQTMSQQKQIPKQFRTNDELNLKKNSEQNVLQDWDSETSQNVKLRYICLFNLKLN